MIVYGSSLSPFVRKAVAFAREKGIAIEHRQTTPGSDDAEFRACSPFGKIPGLADGDYRLCDSSAIVHYLEAKHPEPSLIPSEPEALGRVMWFDEFADTILTAAGVAVFFNRIVAGLVGATPDLAAAERAEAEQLPPILAYLEREIGEREWLVGDALSLADVAVAAPFKNLEYAEAKIDWAAYPRTEAFVARVLGRDSFAELLANDAKFLASVLG